MTNGKDECPGKNHRHGPEIDFPKVAMNRATFFCKHGAQSGNKRGDATGDVDPQDDTQK